MNSIILASVVSYTIYLLGASSGVLGVFLLAPSLLQFGNHTSNYIFLVSVYIVNGLFIWPLLSGKKTTNFHFGFLAIVNLVAFLSGRFGLFACLILAAIGVIRWFQLGLQGEFERSDVWGTLLASLPVPVGLLIFGNEPFFQYLANYMAHFNVRNLALVFIAMAVVCSGLYRLGLWLSHLETPFFQTSVWHSGLRTALILVLSGWLGLPLALKHWPLPDIEFTSNFISTPWFVSKSLISFVKNQHPLWNDFFLVDSFWSGFGAPEIMLPAGMIALLKIIPWAFIATAIWVFSSKPLKDWAAPTFAMLSLCGFYLAGVAYVLAESRANMQGRYLIGL
ncbi:MAG: hypothetical protein FJX95_10820, partial [Bacteroidetes bacterium]|nr:hypothetical protein [Bacteroidota bacterium]